jgi:Ca-activated chloride channel family protein
VVALAFFLGVEHIAAAVAVSVVLTLAAEWLHARRIARVASLAFGPGGRPSPWVRLAPWGRALSAGLLVLGLGTLLRIEPKVHSGEAAGDEEEFRHLVLVLDVSPSMRLQDAGPSRKQARRARAKDVLDSMFGRVSLSRYRISVVATYNGAKPVVVDTSDAEVVRNILEDLPMEYAFRPGQTRLFDGLAEAARIARPWDPGSATLVVVSDGDTVPATGMPQMPPSVSGVLVVGVGDPLAGSFIDGRQSRQDVASLRQLASRLGGIYHDGNLRHVASDAIRQVTSSGKTDPVLQLTEREYALLAIGLGAGGLAFLPLLLALFGSLHRPGLRPGRPSHPRPGLVGGVPSR